MPYHKHQEWPHSQRPHRILPHHTSSRSACEVPYPYGIRVRWSDSSSCDKPSPKPAPTLRRQLQWLIWPCCALTFRSVNSWLFFLLKFYIKIQSQSILDYNINARKIQIFFYWLVNISWKAMISSLDPFQNDPSVPVSSPSWFPSTPRSYRCPK